METLTLYQIVGLFGFFGYIGGFTALQLGWIDGNSKKYSLISVVSATFVLIGLTEQFNLASALIQVCWIVIGLVGLTPRLMRENEMLPPQQRIEPSF